MNPAARVAAAVTAGMIGLAVITGCVPSRTAPKSEPVSPVATPMQSSVLQAPLPIASYELTTPQMADVQYLTQRLRQLCMRGFGFDFLPELSTASISQTVRIAQEFDSRWYGVSDPSAARAYGYQLPTWVAGTAAPTAIAKLPAAERSVFLGSTMAYDNRPVPEGGCVTQAADQLIQAGIGVATQQSGGGDPSDFVASMRAKDFQEAQSDPRTLAVFAKWSACMSSFGYHYNSPFEPLADPRWTKTATPSPAQIQTAERDITCKLRVNLLGVEYAVVSDRQNSDIAKNAPTMAAVKTQVAHEAAAVQRLMAAYDHPE